mmetsp:Transcript_101633/g.175484  ORF Transcript_101633/g.175484 Transcript_101633/m.175484 type:complete len:95 (-) Transcript_101633:53-337(-)
MTHLRSFLGAYNFVRSHFKVRTAIQGLAPLLKKNMVGKWTEKEQAAADKVRTAVQAAMGVYSPIPRGDMLLITDSSTFGGGGTLSQWQPKDYYV